MALVQNTALPVNLTNIVNTAEREASSLASTLTPTLSSLTSTVAPNMTALADGLKSKVDGLVTASATSALGSLTGSLDGLAKNVSSTLSTLTSNTTLSGAQDLRKTIGDPMVAAFSSLAPNITSFITSSSTNQFKNLDFSKMLNFSGSGLKEFGKSALSAVSSRLGISIPGTGKGLGDLKSMVAGALTSNAIGGLVGKVTSAVGIKLPSIPKAVTTGLPSLLGTAKSVLGAALPKNILSTFNGKIPTLTQSNGKPFAGTPTNTDPDILSGVTKALNTLGVTNPFSNAKNPNITQNLWGAALNSCVENGLAPAVQSLCTSPHGSTSYGQQMSSTLLYNNASSANVGIVGTLISSIGGKNLHKKKGLAQKILTNQTITKAADGVVVGILDKLGLDVSDIFGTGTQVNQVPVWNANTLNQTNPNITNTLGIDKLRQLTQGTPMTIKWN